MEIWNLYNKDLKVIGEHIRGTEMLFLETDSMISRCSRLQMSVMR